MTYSVDIIVLKESRGWFSPGLGLPSTNSNQKKFSSERGCSQLCVRPQQVGAGLMSEGPILSTWIGSLVNNALTTIWMFLVRTSRGLECKETIRRVQ